MRPLRLLLSLCTSFIAIFLLLYVTLGSTQEEELESSPAPTKGSVGALFSFTSPGALFPPSAIISLTDDNSTFFLARPAAFGPSLPSGGLSGPLWIGSDFGDDPQGKTELGCSDIPGWSDHGDDEGSDIQRAYGSNGESFGNGEVLAHDPESPTGDDGTDDHLHRSLMSSSRTKSRKDHSGSKSQKHKIDKEIAGKVVLLKRGGCGFLEKVKWAQRRHGVALIVGDDSRGGGLVRMYAHGDTSNVSIPALFTSHTTAHLLSSLLPSEGSDPEFFSEDATTLDVFEDGKDGAYAEKHENEADNGEHNSSTQSLQPEVGILKENTDRLPANGGERSWFGSFLARLGFGGRGTVNSKAPSDNLIIGTNGPKSVSTDANPPNAESTTSGGVTKGTVVLPPHRSYRRGEDQKERLGVLFGRKDTNIGPDSKSSDKPGHHDGLWVTLTPTNMSTSPFFDTLLVLVVSPLVTLTVVYALLLLRSRIRRRRWRAPKSVVDRLPVRTYHTISDSTPSATPGASSPTTPLLQHSPSRPTSSPSRPRSQTTSDVPATSSSFQQSSRTREEEKRGSGLAEWRRRYGGRQKECVVCLDEYVDGVSQVMSLPCGHEFHADCITPWLVTRRRTCPICKGDVVRSLSQSYHNRTLPSPSSADSPRLFDEGDDLQARVAETRNDSPSALRPVVVSSATTGNPEGQDADVEANWSEADTGEQGRNIQQGRADEFGNSVRHLSSTVSTSIWRGFDAVRSATGLQRRPSPDGIDRDR